MSLNDLAKEIHELSVSKGWWEEPRKLPEILMLCVSELSEALEIYRTGFDEDAIIYNKKPEGVPIELADCIIRILDYCAAADIDINEAIRSKHEYNKTRPYRHGGKIC